MKIGTVSFRNLFKSSNSSHSDGRHHPVSKSKPSETIEGSTKHSSCRENNLSAIYEHEPGITEFHPKKRIPKRSVKSVTDDQDLKEVKAMTFLARLSNRKNRSEQRRGSRGRSSTWPVVLDEQPKQPKSTLPFIKWYRKRKKSRTCKSEKGMQSLLAKPRERAQTITDIHKERPKTEELWWKDIHEPIENIMETIQKKFREVDINDNGIKGNEN